MRPWLLWIALMLAAGITHAEPVRLVFVGDVMLGDGPGRAIAAGRDRFASFAPILADSDLAVGNLECPIARIGKPLPNKFFTFRAQPRLIRFLKGRFDALAVSNNHSGDYGTAAFLETLGRLDRNGIAYFGGGTNLVSAHAPLIVERKGLRIALLGYNEFIPRSFEAGPDWPGVAWREDSQVIADIRAARASGADLLIPFMHWGWGHGPRPSERHRQLAR